MAQSELSVCYQTPLGPTVSYTQDSEDVNFKFYFVYTILTEVPKCTHINRAIRVCVRGDVTEDTATCVSFFLCT